jgi:hypothetical protein
MKMYPRYRPSDPSSNFPEVEGVSESPSLSRDLTAETGKRCRQLQFDGTFYSTVLPRSLTSIYAIYLYQSPDHACLNQYYPISNAYLVLIELALYMQVRQGFVSQ